MNNLRNEWEGSWAPYGERFKTESELGDIILPQEAALVFSGASRKERNKLKKLTKLPNNLTFEQKSKFFEDYSGLNADSELDNILRKSNTEQYMLASKLRTKELEIAPAYTRLLGKAVLDLASQDYWSIQEAEMINQRLYGPDTYPYVEFIPTTPLEAGRMTSLDQSPAGWFDVSRGTINEMSIMDSKDNLTNHTKAHEWMHAISGTDELTSGLWNHGREEKSDGFMPNEAWVELAARELIKTNPKKIGPRKAAYQHWAKAITDLKKQSPELFNAITATELTEISPEWTDRNKRLEFKQEKLRELNGLASKKLGVSLDEFFQNYAKMSDYF